MIVIRQLQLQPGATLEVNVRADGQSDKVQVLGTAQLAGQVLALAQDGGWQPHTRYTILQADQGLGETQFDRAAVSTDASGLAFLEPELSYDEHRVRSEEHTSELQSLMRISYAGLCLKKKKNKHDKTTLHITYTHLQPK